MAMSTSHEDGRGGRPTPPPSSTPSAASPPKDESGLHEIRQLARSTLERKAERAPDDVEDSGPLLAAATSGSLAKVVLPEPGKAVAPALASSPTRKMPWMAAAIASGLVLAGIALAVVFLSGGDAAPGADAPRPAAAVVESPAAGPMVTPVEWAPGERAEVARVAPPSASAAAAAPDPEPSEKPPGSSAAGSGSPEETGAKAAAPKPIGGGRAGGRPIAGPEEARAASVAASTPTAPSAAAADPPVAAPAPPAKPIGPLDEILAETSEPKVAAEEKPTEALPAALSRADVKDGMRTIRARIQACYEQHQVAGTLTVKLRIEPDGTVSSAETVDPKFKGTPTGLCVAEAVKQATFRRFAGAPMTIHYPFTLE